MSKIEWAEGYTGGLSYAYQSDHEGYIDGEYSYATYKYIRMKLHYIVLHNVIIIAAQVFGVMIRYNTIMMRPIAVKLVIV